MVFGLNLTVCLKGKENTISHSKMKVFKKIKNMNSIMARDSIIVYSK